MTAPATVVIGIGNPMRRDDGVGPEVVERLRSDDPVAETLVLDGEPARLVEAWTGRHRAVVVDAVRTGEPAGTIHEIRVTGDETFPRWDRAAGTHGAGVAAAVALGRALDRLPTELVVLGVEPADLSDGPGLSPPVAAVVDAVADLVRERAAP